VYLSGNDSNAGGMIYELHYLSNSYHGFEIGTGFQYSHDIGLHGEDESGHDDERVSINAVNMHRAYLKYNFLKSHVTFGRQKIKTPLVMNDDLVWGVRDSFDGATVTLNNIIPDTVAKIIYINAWNKKNSGDTSWYSDEVSGDVKFNGVYSLYVENKSIKGLTLDAQYLAVDEDEDSYNGDVHQQHLVYIMYIMHVLNFNFLLIILYLLKRVMEALILKKVVQVQLTNL
jgi:hypothetical protein